MGDSVGIRNLSLYIAEGPKKATKGRKPRTLAEYLSYARNIGEPTAWADALDEEANNKANHRPSSAKKLYDEAQEWAAREGVHALRREAESERDPEYRVRMEMKRRSLSTSQRPSGQTSAPVGANSPSHS